MQLASFLNAQDICVEQRILTKMQVYEILVERICHHHKLPICGKKLLDMVIKRDEEAPTAYNTGICIPHIRMEGFQDTVVAMAFLQNPIDMDGIKVSWVVLIITDISSSKLYLNMVAALLRISKDESIMRLLASAHDGHGVLHHLRTMAVDIKKDLTIEDIMILNPIAVKPQQTLKELGMIMHDNGFSVIPVVDDNNKFLGEVSLLNFLKVGVPDYLMMLDNLNFLQSFEPLENLFEKQDTVKVQDIMRDDEVYLAPSASIVEAVFVMISHNKRQLPIVQDSKLVGVVTAMDIFRKVIQA